MNKPKSETEFPHRDLILEENINEKELPVKIQNEMRSWKARFGKYSNNPTEELHNQMMNKSVEIADEIQTWLEDTKVGQEFNTHIAEGDKQMGNKDFTAALEAYGKAQKVKPDDDAVAGKIAKAEKAKKEADDAATAAAKKKEEEDAAAALLQQQQNQNNNNNGNNQQLPGGNPNPNPPASHSNSQNPPVTAGNNQSQNKGDDSEKEKKIRAILAANGNRISTRELKEILDKQPGSIEEVGSLKLQKIMRFDRYHAI